ncbi:HAD family hydrolase [Desertihabitans aurantiacus]|uniref:HAD family hydrolase n=1 Tax=Desertihabitans aurantiacus TaxID=2282477 RepID=UPI000DF7C26A|nr:HAD-IA family hydrolase [Desertihabitans aurantiacus]
MRCLLLDLDGVLRHWDPDIIAAAERRARLPAGSLAAAAFDPELLGQVVTGAVDDPGWRRSVTERLVREHGPRAAQAVAEWSQPAGAVDREVLQVVREVRRTAEVALLTNATSRLRDDLAALGLLDEVDHVLNSSELGVAKPDPRVFATAAERAGHPLESCWFVDDTLGNVEAARAVGLRAHHHTTVDALRAFLG